MKSSGNCVLVLILTVMASVAGYAEDSLPTDRPVTLKELIVYALTNHDSVRSAEQGVVASTAAVHRAKAGYAPQVVVGSAFSSIGLLAGTGVTGFVTSGNTDTVLAISQPIYDGGKTQTAVRQARASKVASDADLELTIQDRILSVTTSYFNSLLAQRLADIAAQSVRESEGQLELVQARIDAKDAAPVDRYPVEVELANAKLRKLQADNDVRVAANSLRNAVGLDRGPGLQLVDVSGEPTEEAPKFEEALAKALRDRPELIRSAAQIESLQASLNLAKLETLPIPSANAGYQQDLDGDNIGKQWTVGVALDFTIFDGGSLAAGVTSARARLRAAKLADDQLRKDVSSEVEEAYLNLTSAIERLEASKINVTQAQKNLEVMREKYTQGLAIPLEIVNAQVSYANALATNAQALYGAYVARATLDMAIGKRGY